MILSKFPVLRKNTKNLLLFRGICVDQKPPPKPMVVTIIGGNTGEGQLAALLLKQSKLVDEIRLYSGLIGTCGIGLDLSHIDTNTIVKAYTGQELLKDAITDAQIVLICGGLSKKPCKKQAELFEENADYVRNVALYMGEFNPRGIICISTPPVNSMVPMVSEEMKKANAYDPARIMGITTLSIMRTNALVAKYLNKNPTDVAVPVIGGMCRKTAVAVFSQVKPPMPVEKALAALLQDKISSAEDEALDLKYIENTGCCFVSSAFACARYVTSVIKGLKGEPNVIECAYVRQTGHIQSFLTYMSSIVKLVAVTLQPFGNLKRFALSSHDSGPEGVESCHMPKLNQIECENLQRAYPFIKKSIEIGQCYITGDIPNECRCQPRLSGQCTIVTKKQITKIGDIDLVPDDTSEKCIEIIT